MDVPRACLVFPGAFTCLSWLTDAVPKKRGPKTDVLEALLKRVDGLEARLKDKKTEPETETPESDAISSSDLLPIASTSHAQIENKNDLSPTDTGVDGGNTGESAIFSPTEAE